MLFTSFFSPNCFMYFQHSDPFSLQVKCVEFFDSLRIDDPVSAISVHLGCGIWGTLATALFAEGPGALYAAGEGPPVGNAFTY